jgi:hypothetical protein
MLRYHSLPKIPNFKQPAHLVQKYHRSHQNQPIQPQLQPRLVPNYPPFHARAPFVARHPFMVMQYQPFHPHRPAEQNEPFLAEQQPRFILRTLRLILQEPRLAELQPRVRKIESQFSKNSHEVCSKHDVCSLADAPAVGSGAVSTFENAPKLCLIKASQKE